MVQALFVILRSGSKVLQRTNALANLASVLALVMNHGSGSKALPVTNALAYSVDDTCLIHES